MSGRLYFLAILIALTAVNTPSRRIAFGQSPDLPAPNLQPDGSSPNRPNPINILRGEPLNIWVTPEPAPSGDSAGDTINMMERARARAGGTPVPEPTQRNGLSAQ
jgi:hypothetical protein